MFGELFGDMDVEVVGDTATSSSSNGNLYKYDSAGARIPRPKPRRPLHGFVGLDNQGATCYLNSLIQALYMTPELRQVCVCC